MKEILIALGAANLVFLINNNNKIKSIMATLAEVQQSLTDLQTSVDTKQEAIIAKIQELKDQIGTGGEVTEADLDGLLTTVQGIKTDVDSTDLS